MLSLTTFLSFMESAISIGLTLFIVIVALAFWLARPTYRFITILSNATNEEGIEKLADFIAKTTGGKNIDVTTVRQSFMPAAHAMSTEHLKRRKELEGGY